MPQSPVHLQDPLNAESSFLLETLLEKASKAEGGAAAFAWASEQGVRLLLRDKVFARFLRRCRFDLIIGVDTTTTPRALEELKRAERDFKGLSAKVFLTPDTKRLFHPKLSWFSEPGGGSAVVGSGNLTMAGLRHNWEAFADCRLTSGQVEQLRQDWQTWVELHSARLHPVHSPDVLKQAEANLKRWVRRKKLIPEVKKLPTIISQHEVLIAEIPKSSTRESQVNFHQEAYVEYFGIQEGAQARILFRSVGADGALGDVESRPSVARKSRNWSFELEAAVGLIHPAGRRPVGIYVRVEDQAYLYCILKPADIDFASIEGLLIAKNPQPGRKMRELRLRLSDLPDRVLLRFQNAISDAFADEAVV